MTIEIIERNKSIFWAHRLLQEKTEQLKKIAEEISVLNHQAQNFNKMQPETKNQVIEELNDYMRELKWNYRISELK